MYSKLLNNTFVAYIHFFGVDPDHRKKQLGRKLYELFFTTVRTKGVKTVNSITSLVNKTSIGFHKAIGFTCLGSAVSDDGVAYYPNYEDGKDCVVFEKNI